MVCDAAQGQAKADWKSYFDLMVVSAKKPAFFEEGSVMREVDQVCHVSHTHTTHINHTTAGVWGAQAGPVCMCGTGIYSQY